MAEADLASTLKGKPLYLRGQWYEDNLHFDADGGLLSRSVQTSFTLSGVRVDAIKRRGGVVELKAHREGLELMRDVPRRVRLEEHITIALDVPVSGDFGPAVAAIFTPNLEDLLASAPEYWKPFAAKYPHAGMKPYEESPLLIAAKDTAKDMPKAIGDKAAVSFPKLIKQQDPQFSAASRTERYDGECVVSLVVNAVGVPVEIHIEKAIGLGLDDAAAAAVAAYRFRPAERAGVAVPVFMQVSVTFHNR